MPRNITDWKTIQNLIKEMDFLEVDKLRLVMDRGFYSEQNINALYQHHHKYLLARRTSLKFIQQKLDRVRLGFDSKPNYSSKTNLCIQTFMTGWANMETEPRSGEVVRGKRRMYTHKYLNAQHASDDKARLNALLDTSEYKLTEGKHNPEDAKLYKQDYSVTVSPVRRTKHEPKQEAID